MWGVKVGVKVAPGSPLGLPCLMRFTILTFLLATFLHGQAPAQAGVQATNPAPNCGALGAPSVRTTLYFGLARKTGVVTRQQWSDFVKQEVTKRFPEGLTVWEAMGQWQQPNGKIVRERSKVLLLVHGEKKSHLVAEIIDSYKKRFDQESVLWETSNVCASF